MPQGQGIQNKTTSRSRMFVGTGPDSVSSWELDVQQKSISSFEIIDRQNKHAALHRQAFFRESMQHADTHGRLMGFSRATLVSAWSAFLF